MKDIIIDVFPLVTAIIIVALTYWRELKSNKQQQIYLRKQTFYQSLIQYISSRNFDDEDDGGKNMVKLYNEAYLHANQSVINALDDYFKFTNTHPNFPRCPRKELIPYLKNIILKCRNDLDLNGISDIEAFKYIYRG